MIISSEPRLAARDYMPRAAVVWAGLCLLTCIINLGGILHRRFPDPDDVLRLVQVRDLLAGQGWFDLHQYRINPPAGTLMHWSRLVDLPLALIIGALTPIVGPGLAEQIALIAVPLATLGVIVFTVAYIAARFFDRETLTLACLTLGFSPWVMVQVMPLRIDHHGWQIACLLLALPGLLPGWRARGAIWSGLALSVGLSISLELLPISAAFGVVFRPAMADDAGQSVLAVIPSSLDRRIGGPVSRNAGPGRSGHALRCNFARSSGAAGHYCLFDAGHCQAGPPRLAAAGRFARPGGSRRAGGLPVAGATMRGRTFCGA